MRFDAFQNETLQVQAQENALRAVGFRKYILERELLEREMSEITARVSIYVHTRDQPPQISIVVDHSHFGFLNDFARLSGEQLRKLALIRDAVDHWISGELETLPAKMPWEATL